MTTLHEYGSNIFSCAQFCVRVVAALVFFVKTFGPPVLFVLCSASLALRTSFLCYLAPMTCTIDKERGNIAKKRLLSILCVLSFEVTISDIWKESIHTIHSYVQTHAAHLNGTFK